MVVVDLTSAESCRNAERWIDIARLASNKSHSGTDNDTSQTPRITIIGTKSDLKQRRVDEADSVVVALATAERLPYVECFAGSAEAQKPFVDVAAVCRLLHAERTRGSGQSAA